MTPFISVRTVFKYVLYKWRDAPSSLPPFKKVQQIQKQMQIIQTILPKIKDAGKRAGLIKHFAPKMEQAMDSLENKIKKEK